VIGETSMSYIFKSQRRNIDRAAFKTLPVEENSSLIFEKVLATIIQPSVIGSCPCLTERF